MKFSRFWKMQFHDQPIFEKKKDLSKSEIDKIHEIIKEMQVKGIPAFKIINSIQKEIPKLAEKWKAERAYWTESKRIDSLAVEEMGDVLDVENYKVLLSPSACPLCRQKTQNGSKTFKSRDFGKGEGHVPPFHPNCFCIIVPMN